MKLGPFVTSKASIGSTSAAAGQDVRNAINTGYNKMQNSQTTAQFGSQMMKTSIAADLNKQRATVAAAENNARSAIEQNPDYIDADIVEDMGVEVDEANVIEDENGKRRVRTYSIAEELYSKSVEAGVTEADNRLSFPSVGKRLNDEVSAKYRTAGQNKVATWAVHKQRDLTRQETEVTLDDYRANGQYDEAMESIASMQAAGVFSPAQAESQRDRTRVAGEMRDTNNTLIESQNDFSKVGNLEARIEDYEAHIKNGTTPTNGMSSDDVYSERNRMVAVRDSIHTAQNTRQAVSLVNVKADLTAVVDNAGTGVPSMSMSQINAVDGNISSLLAQGAITQTQYDTVKLKVDAARVVSHYSDTFAKLRGPQAQAYQAQRDLLAEAKRIGGREGGILARKAEGAYKQRVNALASDGARYVENNNLEVRALGNTFEREPSVQNLIPFMKASKQAQEDSGLYPSNVTGLSEDHWFTTESKNRLNGSWQEATELFEEFKDVSVEDKLLIAKSFGGNDRESLIAQAVMLTYDSDPDAARMIHAGSKLENVQINQEELRMKVRSETESSMDPLQADAMIPAIEAYVRYNVANGDMNKEVGTRDVQATIGRLAGPRVEFTTPYMLDTEADKYLPNTNPTRSYRDEYGQWVPTKQIKQDLMEYMRANPEEYKVGGSKMTMDQMRGFVNIVHEADGKYRIDVQQGVGRGEYTLLDENRQPVIIDLKGNR